MQLDLKDLLNFAQGAIIPLLIAIATALHGIRKDLSELSDKLITMEEWQRQHDSRCNERHELHRKSQENLWSELGKVRDRMRG